MVIRQFGHVDAEALRDHERCRVAAEHELLGERIDDIRRRTLVVDDRRIVTLEETAEPRPRNLVPAADGDDFPDAEAAAPSPSPFASATVRPSSAANTRIVIHPATATTVTPTTATEIAGTRRAFVDGSWIRSCYEVDDVTGPPYVFIDRSDEVVGGLEPHFRPKICPELHRHLSSDEVAVEVQ